MKSDDPIIIVTGLPRSGTSMMMQVLKAGGVPVLADETRSADASNPRGYFEFERTKWLAADNSWLADAQGKALKVIVQLAPFLPSGLRYKVLFLERDLDEIMRSQGEMLARLERSATSAIVDLKSVFQENLTAARRFLVQLPQT